MTNQNWGMLGHEWAVQLLKEHIRRGRLRHAYLFSGPRGVGRRSLALHFAQAINCTNLLAEIEPCQTCRSCKQIARMQHPDLAVVQAENVGGELKVDQVRALQHSLALAPYEASYRVALLLRFEQANQNASNALLKTLEEPPLQVILMLTADSQESLLPTIVSRCELLRLRPVSFEALSQGLQTGWGLSAKEASFLAHISAGRPGMAIQLSEEPALLERRNTWLDEHVTLLGATRVERFAYAEALSKDRDKTWDLLPLWLSFWRDVVLCASQAEVQLVNQDHSARLGMLASQVGLPGAQWVVSALERTLDLLEANVNARLALEVLMLDLPHAHLSG